MIFRELDVHDGKKAVVFGFDEVCARDGAIADDARYCVNPADCGVGTEGEVFEFFGGEAGFRGGCVASGEGRAVMAALPSEPETAVPETISGPFRAISLGTERTYPPDPAD